MPVEQHPALEQRARRVVRLGRGERQPEVGRLEAARVAIHPKTIRKLADKLCKLYGESQYTKIKRSRSEVVGNFIPPSYNTI